MTEQRRQHGRAKYVLEHCRCAVCRAANTSYENHRVRQRAYGRWHPYVDADPVRRHIAQLRTRGIGLKRIATQAGVSYGAVAQLVHGQPRRSLAPSKRVRAGTAEKLLAVRPAASNIAAGAAVDSTGAHRRLQALVANGWSQQQLGNRLSMQPANFGRMMRSARITANHHWAVCRLYEQLWSQPPPKTTHRERIAAARARNHAQTHGWAPPMAWDDETIDDPNVSPDVGEVAPMHHLRKLPPVGELGWLLDMGEPLERLADRYQVHARTIERALQQETL